MCARKALGLCCFLRAGIPGCSARLRRTRRKKCDEDGAEVVAMCSQSSVPIRHAGTIRGKEWEDVTSAELRDHVFFLGRGALARTRGKESRKCGKGKHVVIEIGKDRCRWGGGGIDFKRLGIGAIAI